MKSTYEKVTDVLIGILVVGGVIWFGYWIILCFNCYNRMDSMNVLSENWYDEWGKALAYQGKSFYGWGAIILAQFVNLTRLFIK